jgi:hypothetical protein
MGDDLDRKRNSAHLTYTFLNKIITAKAALSPWHYRSGDGPSPVIKGNVAGICILVRCVLEFLPYA